MGQTKTKPSFASSVGRPLLAGALAAGAAAPVPAAADDVFLWLEGLQGESLDNKHRGEIDILSYTQSFANQAVARPGSAGGKATCGPVTVMKLVDRSSPRLIGLVTTGLHIPKAVITFRKAGQTQLEYYRVTLVDVIITEVEQTENKINVPNPAAMRVIEKVSMIARQFHFDYVPQKADGTPDAPAAAGWDCVQNTKF
jgi:type VI secretion system secreted protein Hcp